jgi:thioredoxin 1
MVKAMERTQHNTPPYKIGEDDFQSEVLRSTQPVLVAFWAPWSHPCQILSSVLEEVAAACNGTVKVVKVNADDNPDLSLWYDVQSIPTLLCFANGALRGKLIGTASKEAILAKFQSVFQTGDANSQSYTEETYNEPSKL